jgi:DNA-binding transcriptional LysR family regulator
VAEQGSFSAAADTLSMTQQAVSRQIASLERRLGLRLFRRLARGVAPTAAGTVAVQQATEVLARLQTMESRLKAFLELEAGSLRLSAFSSANTSFVPEAIRRFRASHPRVTLTLVQSGPDGPVVAVRSGRTDIALATAWDLPTEREVAKDITSPPSVDSSDGISLMPLLDEQMRVALPAHHRLAGRRHVPLHELRDETWIEGAHPDCLGPIPDLAEALGSAPHIGFTCDDWNGKQALVAAGVGITLVPTLAQQAIRPDVTLLPTTPPLLPRRLYAVAAAPPFRPPAVTAMSEVLTDIARELSA